MRAGRHETEGETGTAAAQLNRPDSLKKKKKKNWKVNIDRIKQIAIKTKHADHLKRHLYDKYIYFIFTRVILIINSS